MGSVNRNSFLIFVILITFVLALPLYASTDLELETTPSGLPVNLGDQSAGSTPADLTLDSDKNKLTVRNDDRSWSSTVNFSGDAELTLSITDASMETPFRGLILSRPQGAEVLVDGELKGRTPWSAQFESGEPTIKLRKKGYKTWSGTFMAKSDFSLRGILTEVSDQSDSSEKKGEMDQDDRDSGMSESKDKMTGQEQSKSNSNLERIITSDLRAEEKEPQAPDTTPEKKSTKTIDTDSVKTESDTDVMETQEMVANDTGMKSKEAKSPSEEPMNVPVKIESDPSGAVVEINGRTAGKTPFVKQEQPSGTKTITLRKTGYKSWSSTLPLDQPTNLKVKLKSVRARLNLEGKPEDMTVKIENRSFKLGEGKTFELSPGDYEIFADTDGYESYDTEINISRGEFKDLNINLKRVPKKWEFPTTRDVFLELGRKMAGSFIEKFPLSRGDNVQLIPAQSNLTYELTRNSISEMMLEKGINVVEQTNGMSSELSVNNLLKFNIINMDVAYEQGEKRHDMDWTKRRFTLKMLGKLVDPSTGKIKGVNYFTRTIQDQVPTKFKEELKKPYNPTSN